MLFRLQLRPLLALQQVRAASRIRNATTIASTREEDDDDGVEESALTLRRKAYAPVASTWLNGEGSKYKDPKLGTNWLGGSTVSNPRLRLLLLLISISRSQ